MTRSRPSLGIAFGGIKPVNDVSLAVARAIVLGDRPERGRQDHALQHDLGHLHARARSVRLDGQDVTGWDRICSPGAA